MTHSEPETDFQFGYRFRLRLIIKERLWFYHDKKQTVDQMKRLWSDNVNIAVQLSSVSAEVLERVLSV